MSKHSILINKFSVNDDRRQTFVSIDVDNYKLQSAWSGQEVKADLINEDLHLSHAGFAMTITGFPAYLANQYKQVILLAYDSSERLSFSFTPSFTHNNNDDYSNERRMELL